MIFNSIDFLIFLPIVFILYWQLKNNINLQNLFIVVVSYIFYGWWDYRFLFLISFTSLCSFYSGIMIDYYQSDKSKKRLIAICNILINIGILAVFKYYNFFIQSLSYLLLQFGIHLDFITINIILPVGISFYTFQALSYTIDVYRGDIKASHNIISFFAYISFFPQLVAGPIERSTNLLPQFSSIRTFKYETAIDGLRQMLWGFFKKIVVADNCAAGVNHVFAEIDSLDSISLFYGALMFSMQIYGDFSGYSDIAIGTSKIFGIKLMKNFNYPYFTRDIAEFWRKWHISLTTWFRDYLYIPMGGSRYGKLKSIKNTLIIFLTSGLWHGANWTFLLWGAYHALLFIPLLITNKNRKHLAGIAEHSILPSFKELIQMTTTFILVLMGWIIFRAENIGIAIKYYNRMFTNFELTLPVYGKTALIWIIIMLVAEWLQRDKQHTLQIENSIQNKYIRYFIYYAIISIIIIFQGETAQFIYFQF